jgi:hypothetical protein
LAVATQSYIGYQHYLHSWRTARSTSLAAVASGIEAPVSLLRFLQARVEQRPLLWGMDLVLTAGAAATAAACVAPRGTACLQSSASAPTSLNACELPN